MGEDREFVEAVHRAADDRIGGLMHEDLPGQPMHREEMTALMTLVAGAINPQSRYLFDAAVLNAAHERAVRLEELQTSSGLFQGGDNVQSPPDSAFTISDLCDLLTITKNETSAGVLAIRSILDNVRRRSVPALVQGGVHTPNHRWELSAALARLDELDPDERVRRRAFEWLKENVDIGDDGFYSERSPNYAAHVTNPSLLCLAKLLHLPGLRSLVERNLETTLDLIRPDGSVETIHSRRQDQGLPFSLASYLVSYRSLALSTGRGDFAWAALTAASVGGIDHSVLPALLLEPTLATQLPAPIGPPTPRTSFYPTVGLAANHSQVADVVVYGGSDYTTSKAIRSGLANNPTFLRMFAGKVVLDALRLSRNFFDLGPFRADTIERSRPDKFTLSETISAAFYQPLPQFAHDPAGRYRLGDDGRFSASMDFSQRPHTDVHMNTTIHVTLRDNAADVEVTMSSPPVAWSLELTFRRGGTLNGVEPLGADRWVLTGPQGSYQMGRDRLVFGPGGIHPEPGRDYYQPGQDYTVTAGTDATSGVKVYILGTSPGRFTLQLQAEQLEIE